MHRPTLTRQAVLGRAACCNHGRPWQACDWPMLSAPILTHILISERWLNPHILGMYVTDEREWHILWCDDSVLSNWISLSFRLQGNNRHFCSFWKNYLQIQFFWHHDHCCHHLCTPIRQMATCSSYHCNTVSHPPWPWSVLTNPRVYWLWPNIYSLTE